MKTSGLLKFQQEIIFSTLEMKFVLFLTYTSSEQETMFCTKSLNRGVLSLTILLSLNLSIYFVSHLSEELKYAKCSNIMQKFVALPHKDGFVVIPLLTLTLSLALYHTDR